MVWDICAEVIWGVWENLPDECGTGRESEVEKL